MGETPEVRRSQEAIAERCADAASRAERLDRAAPLVQTRLGELERASAAQLQDRARLEARLGQLERSAAAEAQRRARAEAEEDTLWRRLRRLEEARAGEELESRLAACERRGAEARDAVEAARAAQGRQARELEELRRRSEVGPDVSERLMLLEARCWARPSSSCLSSFPSFSWVARAKAARSCCSRITPRVEHLGQLGPL